MGICLDWIIMRNVGNELQFFPFFYLFSMDNFLVYV